MLPVFDKGINGGHGNNGCHFGQWQGYRLAARAGSKVAWSIPTVWCKIPLVA